MAESPAGLGACVFIVGDMPGSGELNSNPYTEDLRGGPTQDLPYTDLPYRGPQAGRSLIQTSPPQRSGKLSSPHPDRIRDQLTSHLRRGLAAAGGGLKADGREPGWARRVRVHPPDRPGLGELRKRLPYTEDLKPGGPLYRPPVLSKLESSVHPTPTASAIS